MSVFRICLLLACIDQTAMLGQHCPQTALSGASVPSEIVILEGKLVFHDDIRKWFELVLDQPQCGDDSVQVVRGGND